MSASAKNPSPEIAGLIAADSGFALVETAFIPGSGGIGRASLWVIAAVSLGSLAAAAGVTIAKDAPVAMAVATLPAAPDAAPALAAVPAFTPPTAAATVTAAPTAAATIAAAPTETMPSAPAKNARVLPVVLRGHPPSHAGNRL
ncbi:MAG: hypothetical protein JO008_10675 [Alphaproteobacteria bacterium]|nr:hypothetical protein [Alphaproteobacteria bacterium]